jgi:hypothetical protein
MKKTIRIAFILCFLLAIGMAGKTQCSATMQWASCTSYGAGNAGGSWTLNCPTGNASYDMEIYTYAWGINVLAIADMGSSDGRIQDMMNLGGSPGHVHRNGYFSEVASTLDVFISVYADSNSSAYTSVTLW